MPLLARKATTLMIYPCQNQRLALAFGDEIIQVHLDIQIYTMGQVVISRPAITISCLVNTHTMMMAGD